MWRRSALQQKEGVVAGGLSLTSLDGVLDRSLTGLASRQRAIAQNMANLETPGYKAKDVRFEDVLRSEVQGQTDASALRLTKPGHIDPGAPARQVGVVTPNTKMRADGNSVDLDEEMIKLADTQLTYDAVSQIYATRNSIMQSIVHDGKR